MRNCPADCSGNGECLPHANFSCACYEGFTGRDCSLATCGSDCSGHGYCYNGTCYCKPGFMGLDCAHSVCANA